MLRRFDSEFARVMNSNQRKKAARAAAAASSQSNTATNHHSGSRNNINTSRVLSSVGEKGGARKLVRPSTAVPKRFSPKRITTGPFTSKKRDSNKNTHKKLPERPNDKDRMDRRSARRKKNKPLRTSKAAARVYRSIGKKTEPVDKLGKWR